MEWVKNTTKFISGDRLFVGKWNVGGVHYDSLRTKTAKNQARPAPTETAI